MSVWDEQGHKDGRSDAKSGKDSTSTVLGDIFDVFTGNSEYRDSYNKAYKEAEDKD